MVDGCCVQCIHLSIDKWELFHCILIKCGRSSQMHLGRSNKFQFFFFISGPALHRKSNSHLVCDKFWLFQAPTLIGGGKWNRRLKFSVKSRNKHIIFLVFVHLFIAECYLLNIGFNLAYGLELHLKRGERKMGKKSIFRLSTKSNRLLWNGTEQCETYLNLWFWV